MPERAIYNLPDRKITPVDERPIVYFTNPEERRLVETKPDLVSNYLDQYRLLHIYLTSLESLWSLITKDEFERDKRDGYEVVKAKSLLMEFRIEECKRINPET